MTHKAFFDTTYFFFYGCLINVKEIYIIIIIILYEVALI